MTKNSTEKIIEFNDIGIPRAHKKNTEQHENNSSDDAIDKQNEREITAEKYGVCEGENCYLKAKKQTKEEEAVGTPKELYPITDFIIEPIEKREGVNGEIEFIAKVKSNILSRELTFDINHFNNTQKFKDVLKDFSVFNKAGTDDITGIKRYLLNEKKYKTKIGMAYIGMHNVKEQWIYVGNNIAIDQKGKTHDNLCIMKQSEVIKSSITNSEEITKDELEYIGKALFNFNKIDKCIAIMGTIGAFFLKEKLRRLGTETHILQLIGEKGSGKSQTLKNIIGEILGTKTEDIKKADGFTKFTLIKSLSSSNLIPFMIDEYKPFTMGKPQKDLLHSHLRSVYDGTGAERGRADRTIEHYQLLAPVIIAGEANIQDHAITERSCLLEFAKIDIQDEEIKKNYKILIDSKDKLNKLGKSLLMLALNKDINELKKDYKKTEELLIEEIKVERTKTTTKNIIIGLKLMIELFKKNELNFEKITGLSMKIAIEKINNIIFQETLENSEEGKTIIDSTIEVFEKMAIQKEILSGLDYEFINKGTEIAFNIKRFYDKFTGYVKRNNVEMEVLTQHSFTKQLRKEKYYANYKSVRMQKELMTSYVLNVAKLKEKNIELDGFTSSN